MKTQLILACTALLATGAFATYSPSASDSGKGKGMFATLDKDSDGQLSKEEAAASDSLASSFSTIDGNADGFISKDEFRRKVRTKRSDY